MAISSRSSSEVTPNCKSQLLRAVASSPRGPPEPRMRGATCAIESCVNSSGVTSGTLSQCSKAVHLGLQTSGTLVSGCLPRRTSITGSPDLVHLSEG
eukprot:14833421-Ditylum_brightwellii.AAC.1